MSLAGGLTAWFPSRDMYSLVMNRPTSRARIPHCAQARKLRDTHWHCLSGKEAL